MGRLLRFRLSEVDEWVETGGGDSESGSAHKTAKNESNHQVWPRIPFSARVGSRVSLKGYFDVPVILEDVRPLGTDGSAGYECRVRLPGGARDEADISS